MKINGEKVAQWTCGIIMTIFALLMAAGFASDVYESWAKVIATTKMVK